MSTFAYYASKYIFLNFSCSAHRFVEGLLPGDVYHLRRCRGRHFHRDSYLASSGTNLIHLRHDVYGSAFEHSVQR